MSRIDNKGKEQSLSGRVRLALAKITQVEAFFVIFPDIAKFQKQSQQLYCLRNCRNIEFVHVPANQ